MGSTQSKAKATCWRVSIIFALISMLSLAWTTSTSSWGAAQAYAAEMEIERPPAADFEPSRPEIDQPPGADLEQSDPEVDDDADANFEPSQPEIDQPPPADLEPSDPEVEDPDE